MRINLCLVVFAFCQSAVSISNSDPIGIDQIHQTSWNSLLEIIKKEFISLKQAKRAILIIRKLPLKVLEQSDQ